MYCMVMSELRIELIVFLKKTQILFRALSVFSRIYICIYIWIYYSVCWSIVYVMMITSWRMQRISFLKLNYSENSQIIFPQDKLSKVAWNIWYMTYLVNRSEWRRVLIICHDFKQHPCQFSWRYIYIYVFIREDICLYIPSYIWFKGEFSGNRYSDGHHILIDKIKHDIDIHHIFL